MPVALVTVVETDPMASKQSPHQSSEGNFTGAKEKVIRKKCPGRASRFSFRQNLPQPFQKIPTIAIIPEDGSAFNAPDDMIKTPGASRRADRGMAPFLSCEAPLCQLNYLRMSPFFTRSHRPFFQRRWRRGFSRCRAIHGDFPLGSKGREVIRKTELSFVKI